MQSAIAFKSLYFVQFSLLASVRAYSKVMRNCLWYHHNEENNAGVSLQV